MSLVEAVRPAVDVEHGTAMTRLSTTHHTRSQEPAGIPHSLSCMREPDPGVFKPVEQGVVQPPHGHITGSVILAVVGVLLSQICVLIRQAVLIMRILLLMVLASQLSLQ
eukprot:TRINITY_DN139750_c0_g1_i1.p2 TRINITY_DN139750_c0_g1~~TRINITY_DN139750_c0_g1_i1.p2  ORF type:complete len:109 (+),score=4.68 TRINITY_DN139750_c0_g1_i1:3-329(+)